MLQFTAKMYRIKSEQETSNVAKPLRPCLKLDSKSNQKKNSAQKSRFASMFIALFLRSLSVALRWYKLKTFYNNNFLWEG